MKTAVSSREKGSEDGTKAITIKNATKVVDSTLGFLNWPAFILEVFRNLTFAQDIFAIFEDEMFVEVFPRLDNIQRLAQDIVSNSDFKFRPPYLRNYYKRSYRGPKDRGSESF